MVSKPKNSDLAPIIIPQGPPVESVEDYFLSKRETELMKIAPDIDPVGRTPGVVKARAQRQYISAKEDLKECLDEQIELRKHMDSQWNKLTEHQLMLRDAFIKFNQFVIENEDKRSRAERKLAEDESALKTKSDEEQFLTKEIDEMRLLGTDMEQLLQKYSAYEASPLSLKNYLASVAEAYGEFKSPVDIIRRFETLESAKNELSERQEGDLDLIETACTDINRLLEGRIVKISELNCKLSEMRQRYDKAKTESKCWEMILNRLKEECASREIEFCRVRESLWSLYSKICRKKGIPAACKRRDYEGQLVLVMRGITEIRTIVKEAKERAKQDTSSVQVQASSKK